MEYVKCPSCGITISDKYDLYIQKRNEYLVKTYPDLPADIVETCDVDIDLGFIFDELGVEKYCCRMHFTTAMQLFDVLK